MIAFDTNVLLRLLLNDDARQARIAQGLLDHAVARSDKVLLPDIVLCELEWVLDSVYEVPEGGDHRDAAAPARSGGVCVPRSCRRGRSAQRLRGRKRGLLGLPHRRIRRASRCRNDLHLRPRPPASRRIHLASVTPADGAAWICTRTVVAVRALVSGWCRSSGDRGSRRPLPRAAGTG